MGQEVRRTVERRSVAKPPDKMKWANTWLNEVLAVLCVCAALFLLLSIVSFWAGAKSGTTNMMGPLGHLFSTMLDGFLGFSSLVPVAALASAAWALWSLDKKEDALKMSTSSVIGAVLLWMFAAGLCSLFFGLNYGGMLGRSLVQPLTHWIDIWGTGLVILCGLAISLALMLQTGTIPVIKAIWSGSVRGTYLLLTVGKTAHEVGGQVSFTFIPKWLKSSWRFVQKFAGAERRASTPQTKMYTPPEPLPLPRRRKNKLEDAIEVKVSPPVEVKKPFVPERKVVTEEVADAHPVLVTRRTVEIIPGKERQFARDFNAEELQEKEETPWPEYTLPSLQLLERSESVTVSEDDSELLNLSRLIEAKLKDFGVHGRVTEVHPGPVITLFEFEPAAGVKVGRIASLSDDLSMALKATSIRIIAPIPNKGTVGIEIPNKQREIVRFRDVLESDAFVKAESVLNICLGKDTYGEPLVADLATMPHLLIAGSTGTGKSVCINAVLMSLLYKASPQELGLILIDPKILELSIYEGIPHLKVPVVTHPKQAKAVLQWAVDEMHRRYRYIQKFGVRGIDGYNKIVSGEDVFEDVKADPTLTGDPSLAADIANGVDLGSRISAIPKEKLKPLPKIVIIIDEVADLMLSVGRDIEELITRLAQKARAAGIHLIIATQRPSVDVITGLIKANFPARLSFRVSTRVDSRTILDSMGAEKLLGRGDMLFMQPGASSLKRLHGAFVTDAEVKKVVDSVKAQTGPRYDQFIVQACEKALENENADGSAKETSGVDGGAPEEHDAFYDKAVELVLEKGYASTSMIQRVFRLGYNRAARIVEMMEKEGIIGPMDGAKPREVLIQRGSEELKDEPGPVEREEQPF